MSVLASEADVLHPRMFVSLCRGSSGPSRYRVVECGRHNFYIAENSPNYLRGKTSTPSLSR